MLFLLILTAAIAFFMTGLLLRFGGRHAAHYGMTLPQRFHAGHVPRLGGVSMLVACVMGWSWMWASQPLQLANQIRLEGSSALSLCAVALLTVAAGAYEDVTQRLH